MQEAKDMRARIESQRKDVKDRRSRTGGQGQEFMDWKWGQKREDIYIAFFITPLLL